MQGVSGSGKSTQAEILKQQHNAVIVSADHFFVKDNQYKFDGKLLNKAHACCFNTFLQLLNNNHNIIVDNTNTSAIEIVPYTAAVNAINYQHEVNQSNIKYDVTIVRVVRDINSCIKSNIHSVPPPTIKMQADTIDRFHNGGNIYRWNVTTILTPN